MENENTGLLLNKNNITLHRSWFKQMVKLLGLQVQYRAPVVSTKTYNLYGELDTNFSQPISVGVIYDEHPTQKTARLLGWNAELADSSVIVHVPYDLPDLQVGAIFIIPAGIDNAEPRPFKVLRMTVSAIYPSSVACELGPLLINTDDKSLTSDFTSSNFNVLGDESEEYGH